MNIKTMQCSLVYNVHINLYQIIIFGSSNFSPNQRGSKAAVIKCNLCTYTTQCDNRTKVKENYSKLYKFNLKST